MRGGVRPGAGRKSLAPGIRKEPKSVRLPGWLWDWMDQQDMNRAQLIEAAMIVTYDIRPPVDSDVN